MKDNDQIDARLTRVRKWLDLIHIAPAQKAGRGPSEHPNLGLTGNCDRPACCRTLISAHGVSPDRLVEFTANGGNCFCSSETGRSVNKGHTNARGKREGMLPNTMHYLSLERHTNMGGVDGRRSRSTHHQYSWVHRPLILILIHFYFKPMGCVRGRWSLGSLPRERDTLFWQEPTTTIPSFQQSGCPYLGAHRSLRV